MKIERNTRQREAIRSVITSAHRPLAPQEILEEASKKLPGMGIATVYRMIKSLIDEDEITKVDVPGTLTRYEVAHLQHHHHFHCRVCDRVFEVAGCPGNLRNLSPQGFKTEQHEILLTGLCSSCVKKEAK